MGEMLWLAYNGNKIEIEPKMMNRHGLIAGATGTGKTITLKVFIEALSEKGVPVFVTDIKGDVSGLAIAGVENENVAKRVTDFDITDFSYQGFPVAFWDVFGDKGTPVRTTLNEMGAPIIGKLLSLNETQASVLTIAFRIALDEELEIITLRDLRSLLEYVSDNADQFESKYGRFSSQTIATIMRNLVYLEELGVEQMFGRPEFDLNDWMITDSSGKGMINILHSVELYQKPSLYAVFLIWMLDSLFEQLPEVGDLEKPKFVLFFDEAHLMFDDMPQLLVDKIERVVKLIRSKGVGIFFITQNPTDVPASILSQLGNRVQHALRAYTPGEQKMIKATADAFRENENFDTKTALTELGTGEALLSFLDAKGIPTVVERAYILPPRSLMAPIEEAERKKMIERNQFEAKYRQKVDSSQVFPQKEKPVSSQTVEKKNNKATSRKRQSPLEKTMNSAMSTVGREIGKSVMKTLTGFLSKKK